MDGRVEERDSRRARVKKGPDEISAAVIKSDRLNKDR